MTIKDDQSKLVATARIAGVWYLLMAITGVLGFIVFHPQVYISGDPQQTLINLTESVSLARVRLILEFAIIISQALTAVWFYKLFRNINEWAAWAVGIWGTVNAVAIMISAIAMAAAIGIANSSVLPMEDNLLSIQIFQHIIANAWAVGSLFFGLWLIPMGHIVTQSRRMPVWLGYTLIIGGFGYILSTLLHYTGIESSFNDFLTIPATVGEFWMIGYLLIFGIRSDAPK
jgi:hypothetical protein